MHKIIIVFIHRHFNRRKQQLSDIMIDTSLKNSIFTQIENNQQNEPSKNLQIPKLYLNSS